MRKRILAALMTVVMLLGTIISVSADDAPVAKIDNTEYATLQAAIDAAKASNETDITITLLRDVPDGIGVMLTDNTKTKNLVIDFNGFTYTGASDPVGSSGTESQLFHLNAPNYTITMKNGTINTSNPGVPHEPDCTCEDGVEDTGTTFSMLIQNYSSLTLEKMVVDFSNAVSTPCTNSNNYAVSNNKGTNNIVDSTITANNNAVAFDVYNSGTKMSVIDSNITGTIEVAVGNVSETALYIDQNTALNGKIVAASEGTNLNTVVDAPNRTIGDTVSGLAEYNVVFNANGGTLNGSSIRRQSYCGGKWYGLPTPEREYYIFAGWYTAPVGGVKVNYVDRPTTVYAHWTKESEDIFNKAYYDNLPYLLDKPLKVTATSNEGGEIVFNSTRATYYIGDTINGKVTVEDGAELVSFQVNGVDYALKANNTFSMKVTKDTAIVATFKSTAPVTEDAAADTTVEVEAAVTETPVEEEEVEAAPAVKTFNLASMAR